MRQRNRGTTPTDITLSELTIHISGKQLTGMMGGAKDRENNLRHPIDGRMLVD